MTRNLGLLGFVLCACACSSKKPARDDARTVVPLVDNMVSVPAGWFSSGCYRLLENSEDPDHRNMKHCVEEDPPRRLWVSSFEIDRFEVTVAEYLQCLDARLCERFPYPWRFERWRPAPETPAVVPFDEATAFCKWRGKRLPSDAEWQKAARGTDDRIYPWGDAPPTCAQVSYSTMEHDGVFVGACNSYGGQLPPVGTHRAGASPYGAEDLEDSASEWVSDWFNPSPPQPDRNLTAFSRNTVGPVPILEFDWSSVKFRSKDPAIINPLGPPQSIDNDHVNFAPMHATKGGVLHPGISGRSWGTKGDDTGRMYAGFRCVRTIAGPPPPEVRAPAPDEFTFPFREPGYTPPGTPTPKDHKR